MRVIYLRACPKCSGDLRPVTDMFGSYLACIQCGNTLYPDSHGRILGARTSKGGVSAGTVQRKS